MLTSAFIIDWSCTPIYSLWIIHVDSICQVLDVWPRGSLAFIKTTPITSLLLLLLYAWWYVAPNLCLQWYRMRLLQTLLILLQVDLFLFTFEKACTDHSDCTVLGHRWGCLLYQCVDFTKLDLVSCKTVKDCCTEQEGCTEDGFTCFK